MSTNDAHVAQPFRCGRGPSTAVYRFTVLTPTYNRAHTLPRVYRSLDSQTFRDFEWLVVDDGSSDDTADLVAHYRANAWFPVRYIYQEHGHKKKTRFHLHMRSSRVGRRWRLRGWIPRLIVAISWPIGVARYYAARWSARSAV